MIELPVPPRASTAAARRTMQGNQGGRTRPELDLRSELHRRGLRFRVSIRPVPTIRRRADIVFSRRLIAVFMDGCFWHACPQHFRPPATNSSYWSAKITGNHARDRNTDASLASAGWTVVRVWEHEAVLAAADKVAAILSATERGKGG